MAARRSAFVVNAMLCVVTGTYVPWYPGYGPDGIPSNNEVTYKPTTAKEVMEYVKKAASGNPKQTVSTGGGMNSGWWFAGDVAISMENMDKIINVDKTKLTVTTQTGRRAGAIQEAANAQGMMAAIGQAANVGVGFLLNGGFGHQTRLMGLGSDRVVGAEVVLADGSHVCVGDQPVSDPNTDTPCDRQRLTQAGSDALLWAIRGAGPNFASVLSLTVSMVPKRLVDCNFQEFELGTIAKTAASEIFMPYAEYARTAPRNLNVDGIIFYSTDASGWVLGVYNFYFPAGSESPPAALTIDGKSPVSTPVVYTGKEPYELPEIEPSGKITPDALGIDYSRAVWMGLGLYLDSAQALDNVWEALASFGINCPNIFCHVLLQHAGGAISDVPINATAFGASRGIEWMIYFTVVAYKDLDGSDPSSVPALDAYLRQNFRVVLAQSSGTYSTDLSPGDYEFIPYAYGVNMGKLCQLKVQFDPDGMFTAGAVPLFWWCNYQYGGTVYPDDISPDNPNADTPTKEEQEAMLDQILVAKEVSGETKRVVMNGFNELNKLNQKNEVFAKLYKFGAHTHGSNQVVYLICTAFTSLVMGSLGAALTIRTFRREQSRSAPAVEAEELLAARSVHLQRL